LLFEENGEVGFYVSNFYAGLGTELREKNSPKLPADPTKNENKKEAKFWRASFDTVILIKQQRVAIIGDHVVLVPSSRSARCVWSRHSPR
jgi:hypothetical protein